MNTQNRNDVIMNVSLKNELAQGTKHYLTVVMPAYNEGTHIYDNLLKASACISKFVHDFQILAVDDGSSDNTLAELERACEADSKISYISYTGNGGKGFAISTGVFYANANYIAFLDSDLELNPSMLRYFLSELKKQDADIAIGSKLHKQSKLHYPLVRKIISLGYFVLLKLLFHLNLKDTQTGIKLFKAECIKPICETLQTKSFAFDIEILAKATKDGKKIIELPITLEYSRGEAGSSKVSVKTILKAFTDTVAVKKALKHYPDNL